MDCPAHAGTETADAYVAGRLTDEEQSAFEAHFFACETCLRHVQVRQDIRASLAGASLSAGDGQASWLASSRTWIGLAAAAALIVATAIWTLREHAPVSTRVAHQPGASAVPGGSGTRDAPPPAPTPIRPGGTITPPQSVGVPAATGSPAAPAPPSRERLLAQLALVVAPRYVPIAVRGTPDSPGVEAAMAHYVAGRYARAADALGALPAEVATQPQVLFFRGISALTAGRSVEARAALEQVVATGAQPYADEAHFYLGKAAIADGNLVRAHRELTLAEDRAAGPEGEAARMLAQLATLMR